jgi:hypothetical protein
MAQIDQQRANQQRLDSEQAYNAAVAQAAETERRARENERKAREQRLRACNEVRVEVDANGEKTYSQPYCSGE